MTLSKYRSSVIKKAIKDNDPFKGWDVYMRNVLFSISRMETRLHVLRKWIDEANNDIKEMK